MRLGTGVYDKGNVLVLLDFLKRVYRRGEDLTPGKYN